VAIHHHQYYLLQYLYYHQQHHHQLIHSALLIHSMPCSRSLPLLHLLLLPPSMQR
jgi:hypothetical protein